MSITRVKTIVKVSIIAKGYSAFVATEIEIDVTFDIESMQKIGTMAVRPASTKISRPS